MDIKKIITTTALFGAISLGATTASALQAAQDAFNAHYTVQVGDCLTCHAGAAAPKTHTQFGTDWIANGGTKNTGPTGWTALDAMYLSTYGPVKSTPTAAAATTAATDAAASGGCMTTTLTAPLMMVLGMLSLGFFVRRKKA